MFTYIGIKKQTNKNGTPVIRTQKKIGEPTQIIYPNLRGYVWPEPCGSSATLVTLGLCKWDLGNSVEPPLAHLFP